MDTSNGSSIGSPIGSPDGSPIGSPDEVELSSVVDNNSKRRGGKSIPPPLYVTHLEQNPIENKKLKLFSLEKSGYNPCKGADWIEHLNNESYGPTIISVAMRIVNMLYTNIFRLLGSPEFTDELNMFKYNVEYPLFEKTIYFLANNITKYIVKRYLSEAYMYIIPSKIKSYDENKQYTCIKCQHVGSSFNCSSLCNNCKSEFIIFHDVMTPSSEFILEANNRMFNPDFFIPRLYEAVGHFSNNNNRQELLECLQLLRNYVTRNGVTNVNYSNCYIDYSSLLNQQSKAPFPCPSEAFGYDGIFENISTENSISEDDLDLYEILFSLCREFVMNNWSRIAIQQPYKCRQHYGKPIEDNPHVRKFAWTLVKLANYLTHNSIPNRTSFDSNPLDNLSSELFDNFVNVAYGYKTTFTQSKLDWANERYKQLIDESIEFVRSGENNDIIFYFFQHY